MLHLLSNNFVISLCLGFSVLCFVFFSNRNKEQNEKLGSVFYLRLFAFVFFAVLVVLYVKTKDLSLPSLVSKAPQPSYMGSGGGISNNPFSSPSSVDLGLENVDIGNPNF